jgi:hypothetical protein
MAIKIKDFLEAEKITGNKRNTRVEFTCIECKETIEQSLESLLKKGKLICGKCSALKNRDYEAIAKKCKETNLRKYGTTSNLSVINKQRAENGELSGAANPEIKAKMAETNLKKYGSKSPFGNKQVREKVKPYLTDMEINWLLKTTAAI